MKKLRWIVIVVALCMMAVIVGLFLMAPAKDVGTVRRVNRPNPTLTAAMDQAKKGLPQFLEELNRPKDGQRFAFMGRFTTPNGNEYLWVKDPQLEGSQLAGTLDQASISAPVHRGDRVSVPTSDVVDWMIRDQDGKISGNFTAGALH